MKAKVIFPVMLFFNLSVLAQTTTITLQPGPITGKDVWVRDIDPNTNYDGDPDFPIMAWTWGGTPGVQRGLLEFDLSSISPGSVVTDARLSLYHVPSRPHEPQSGSNAVIISRITSSWNEATVTWNTKPTFTTINQATIPSSTSGTQDYENIDVTALVQDMIANPSSSFGFHLKLVTESYYRALVFMSSDGPTPSSFPKLEITFNSPCTVFDTVSVTVYDTVVVTTYDTIAVMDTVAVTDTLFIDVILSVNPLIKSHIIAYPNPTGNLLIIDFDNVTLLTNYSVKIVNYIGQTLFTSPVNVSAMTVDLSQFGEAGIYFLQILDGGNNVVEEKKIVLY